MKKMFAIMTVLVLCLAAAACGNKAEETEEVTEPMVGGGIEGIANPMVQYETLAEINEIAGVAIPAVEGAENELYFVYNGTMAEYQFTLNGLEYSFRGSTDTSEDISGLYLDGELAFEGSDANYSIAGNTQYSACRFLFDDSQYTIVVEDNNTLQNDFDAFCIDLFNAMLAD